MVPVKSQLRIQCFGKMSVSIDDKPFIFKSKKAKELFAYLICNKGGPVKNSVLAEVLWPDICKQNAMDNLYKAVRATKKMRLDDYTIPIVMKHGEIYIDQFVYSCDLTDFVQLYQMKDDMAKCAAAVELYQGALLYDETYDWIGPYEAYYDIRFLKMSELLITHYMSNGNKRMENYYRNRRKAIFSE